MLLPKPAVGEVDEDRKSDQFCALHNLDGAYCSSNSSCYSSGSNSGSDDGEDETDDDNESRGLDESDSEDSDFGAEWTMSKILDIPVWLNQLQTLHFETEVEFEHFQTLCRQLLLQQLRRYNYNTFGSFVNFYKKYAESCRQQPSLSFNDFFAAHRAKFDCKAMSCVGLSIALQGQLLTSLSADYPALSQSVGLVSCEEAVKDVGTYTMHSPNTAKEHVLVAVCIQIGTLLCLDFLLSRLIRFHC